MRILLTCLVVASVANIEVQGQDPQRYPLAVRVQSGRVFRGFVDPRTDEQQLWIRSGWGQAVVLRPVSWDRLVATEVDGDSHSVEDFRALVERLKTLTPRPTLSTSPAENRGLEPIPGCPPAVRSLHAQTHLTNWDADGAVDGYMLIVAPLDECGTMLPIEGIVSATLYGYGMRSSLPTEHWMELARWSQPLRLTCYGPEGGALRLPLDDALLGWDNPRSPRRLLKIRLQAPGHGTFETEIPFVTSRRAP